MEDLVDPFKGLGFYTESTGGFEQRKDTHCLLCSLCSLWLLGGDRL